MNPLLQSVQIALQNAEQKEAITFIYKVVDFCIAMENGKVLDGWPRDLIQLLVAYHIAKDTFIVEYDEEGNILTESTEPVALPYKAQDMSQEVEEENEPSFAESLDETFEAEDTDTSDQMSAAQLEGRSPP